MEIGQAQLNAIALGQDFLTLVSQELEDFKNHGSEAVAIKTLDTGTRSSHEWLDNDLASLGLPGVTIAQYIAAEITSDVSEALDVFDWNSLPEY